MRKLLLLTLLILSASSAFAQGSAQINGNITTSGTNCATVTNCVILPLPAGAASVAVNIEGTFTGTLQFQVAASDPNNQLSSVSCVPPNSTTSVTSVTAAGIWTCPVAGMSHMIVRASALSSGTPNVNLSSSPALSSNPFASGSGTGVSSVSGTANQIDVATGTTTPVVSLDPAITLPGNLTAPTGSTISASGSGVINATQLGGATFAAPGPIGSGTASTGAFTTLSASSAVSGSGFSTYLASPPAIGGTAAAAGSFTTLSASSTVSGTGFSTYLASPPAIGGTAAAAGSFTSLSSSGALTNTLAGAASAPGVTFSGAPFTGGSGTTTFPQTYLNAGAAPTNFATTGTMLGINSPAAIGNLIDAHVNGGGSVFAVASSGTTTLGGKIQATAVSNSANTNHLWYSGTAPTIAAAGCGGSAASIASNNGAGAFTINVGTAPTSGGCAITLPAATTGWNCYVTDITTNSTSVFLQKQTVTSTTGATLVNFSDVAAATAPTASDIWAVSCFAY